MMSAQIYGDLRGDEGLRLKAYADTGGVWTIGYGHTGAGVREGLVWTPAQCELALVADVASVERRLDAEIPWWRNLPSGCCDALANLAFNVGVGEALRWRKLLAALEAGDYELAARELLASEPWRTQVGRRADRLADLIRHGRR